MSGDLDHHDEDDYTDAVKLGDALAGVVQSLGRRPRIGSGQGQGAMGTVSVLRCWDEVVGAGVAAHARPVGVDDGRLLVVVDHPGWATQLRFLTTTILQRLATVAGADVVRSIDVRVRSS